MNIQLPQALEMEFELNFEFPNAQSVVFGAVGQVFEPPEPVLPSVWMQEELVVPDGPRAGENWDPSLTPYVVEIVDALAADSPHNRVVVRKSVQSGVSVAGIGLVGAWIDKSPANMAYVNASEDARNTFNSEKLAPTIENTPVLKSKIKKHQSRSGDGSTVKRKKFPGGSLLLLNANSSTDLKSKTIKYGIADELDEWPMDLEGQGPAWDIFEGRFTAFHASGDYKILEISTPTVVGSSLIDQHFEEGDQRYRHIKCPQCGYEQRLVFENLKFERRPPYGAYYQCANPEGLGCFIEHHEKSELISAGRFIALNEEDGLFPSFHIDALISKLTTWDKIAEAWWKAVGDPLKLKTFFNNWLGLPYEMRGDAPDHERLMERREDYKENTIHPRALMLICGADVQHDGIWAETVAFAPNRESWTVTKRWLPGDTTDANAGAFLLLDALYNELFEDAWGNKRRIDAMGVDAGDGGRANEVYQFTRSRPNCFATKGMGGWSTPAIGTPTKVDVKWNGKKVRRGAELWPIGTWSLKGEFYTNLRKVGIQGGADVDPAGYCHFGEFLDLNFFKQITSEYLASEKKNGVTRKVWKESGPNHLLDCRIIAMAIADKQGLRTMTEAGWLSLAKQLGLPEDLREWDLLSPSSVRLSNEDPAEGDAQKTKTTTFVRRKRQRKTRRDI